MITVRSLSLHPHTHGLTSMNDLTPMKTYHDLALHSIIYFLLNPYLRYHYIVGIPILRYFPCDDETIYEHPKDQDMS